MLWAHHRAQGLAPRLIIHVRRSCPSGCIITSCSVQATQSKAVLTLFVLETVMLTEPAPQDQRNDWYACFVKMYISNGSACMQACVFMCPPKMKKTLRKTKGSSWRMYITIIQRFNFHGWSFDSCTTLLSSYGLYFNCKNYPIQLVYETMKHNIYSYITPFLVADVWPLGDIVFQK